MITKEEIRKIASLSKLFVSEEQLDGLTADMGEIIAFADTINSASEAGASFDGVTGLKNVFREDEVVPSLPQDKILANVDGGENGYFPVRKRM